MYGTHASTQKRYHVNLYIRYKVYMPLDVNFIQLYHVNNDSDELTIIYKKII